MPVLTKGLLILGEPPVTEPSPWLAERAALAIESLQTTGRLRMRVHGESMLPTLWPGDVVEIALASLDAVQPGEIVLTTRDGRFFLHRFVGQAPGGFLLRGDSMPGVDPVFPRGAFLGRLVEREGNNRQAVFSRSSIRLSLGPHLLGWMLCHFDLARRIALKLHAWMRSAAAGGSTTQSLNLRPADFDSL